MIPSSSRDFTSSPIARVPYDVLREIFICCLPRYPLKEQQPNTKIAPMLLGHICSSWRIIALELPTLWSHLSYSLTVLNNDESDGLFKNELEFIRWWRENQGSIAPFLAFFIKHRRTFDVPRVLVKDGMGYMLEYLSSAQYLELDYVYWIWFQMRITAGDKFTFPHLHTLAKSSWTGSIHEIQSKIIPTNSFSALRRLSLHNDKPPPERPPSGRGGQGPIHWTTLTHISLRDTMSSLNFWFSLIRTLPNLQWGYFDFNRITNIENYKRPSKYIHSQLSTLCITFLDEQNYTPQFNFSLFFTDLYLSAVRTLSLAWYRIDQRYNPIAELDIVLQSTPAVTTLALAEDFLPFSDSLVGEYMTPIWYHATQLVNLQLELTCSNIDSKKTRADVQEVLDIFVSTSLFSIGSWLDLLGLTCPIRAVTIVCTKPLSHTKRMAHSDVEALMMSSIRKYEGKAPNIVFEFTSESACHIAADAWNEWGVHVSV